MSRKLADPDRSVASKAIANVMLFLDQDTYTLPQIMRRTGLPRSTAHRLLGELVTGSLLERGDAGGYRVETGLRQISGASGRRADGCTGSHPGGVVPGRHPPSCLPKAGQ